MEKIYEAINNNKVFYPILFGLILMALGLGLIAGSRQPTKTDRTPSRTAQQCADDFRGLPPEMMRQWRSSEEFIHACVQP